MDLKKFAEKFGPLQDGEELVWLGRPGHVRDWDREQWLVIAVNIIGLVFLLFWESELLRLPPWKDSHAQLIHWIAPLMPLPIAIFCVYLMAPRIFVRRWLRKNTTYAITTQRMLSSERSLVAKCQYVRLSDIVKIRSRRENHGFKDFIFWGAKAGIARRFVSFEAVQLPSEALALLPDLK